MNGTPALPAGDGNLGRSVKIAPAVLRTQLALGHRTVVEKSGVKMRVEPEVAVGALDDRHGAGLASR
jgi:hypothetical protein